MRGSWRSKGQKARPDPHDPCGIPWVRRGFAGERYAGRRQKARPDPIAGSNSLLAKLMTWLLAHVAS